MRDEVDFQYFKSRWTPFKRKPNCRNPFLRFRTAPVWVKAKADSEKKVGGSLTIPDGVKSELLKPTEYSTTK